MNERKNNWARPLRSPAGGLVFWQGGTGPVVVFLHGFPLHAEMWEPLSRYVGKDVTFYAADLPGFGASDLGDDPFTMESCADRLVQALRNLAVTPPVVWVGLSMGGYVAWEVLRRHPAWVRGLVMCHTRPTADSPPMARGRTWAISQIESQGPQVFLDGMWPRLVSASTAATAPERVAQLRNQMAEATPATLIAALKGLRERRDQSDLLPTIQVPLLALAGSDDEITPPTEMRTWCQQIPIGVYRELPGVAHLGPWEDPSATAALLKVFFQEVATK